LEHWQWLFFFSPSLLPVVTISAQRRKSAMLIGEGALLKDGKAAGYYNTIQVSYGLQAGIQKYGYALFLMTDSAMKYIDKSDGWEIGVGPSIVVMDVGAATSATTTTLQSEIYAIFFDQKGLMGGLGLQGTKITKIKK
jgi:lipid-binding SYLF domain-containing protein